MQEVNPLIGPVFSVCLFIVGCFLIIIWLGFTLYLKHKWLSFVEDKVDDEHYSFSSNFFSAGLGISRYALIFQFDWQAKRCDRLRQRELVPKGVQTLFIVSNYLWLVAVIVFFGPMFFIR